MISVARVLLITLLFASTVHAQSPAAWKPVKVITIIAGVTPGGPQDRMARAIQSALQDGRLVDVPVTVENRPGAGGAVALSYLNQHAGDGRYVLVNAPTLLSNHAMGKSPIGIADVTPIAVMGVEYQTIVVRTESPLKSGRDVVERLRKDPTSLSASIGTAVGNSAHIAYAMAMKAAGVDIRKLRTVAFNAVPEGITAVLGGHLDLASTPPSGIQPLVATGKLRVLAVNSPQRLGGEFANVPTWMELGIKTTHEVWRGLTGPKGMTPQQIAYWDDLLKKAVETEQWRAEIEKSGVKNVYMNSAQTAKYWKDESEEMRVILTDLGLAKQ